VTLSLYHVIGRGLRAALPLDAYVLSVWATAAATLAALSLVARVSLGGYSLRTLGLFLALAVIPTLAGHGLVNRSLRVVPAPTVGLFLVGEPVGATILAYLTLREVPGAWTMAGGTVVLAALVLLARAEPRPA
jgi:drug/metabolite transporter (DMT)-like permease